jgi:hypothetical protein
VNTKVVVPKEAVERLTNLNSTTVTHLFFVAQNILKAIGKSELRLEVAGKKSRMFIYTLFLAFLAMELKFLLEEI